MCVAYYLHHACIFVHSHTVHTLECLSLHLSFRQANTSSWVPRNKHPSLGSYMPEYARDHLISEGLVTTWMGDSTRILTALVDFCIFFFLLRLLQNTCSCFLLCNHPFQHCSANMRVHYCGTSKHFALYQSLQLYGLGHTKRPEGPGSLLPHVLSMLTFFKPTAIYWPAASKNFIDPMLHGPSHAQTWSCLSP